MKKHLYLFAFLLVAAGGRAQETLFDDLDIIGAFGGPFVEIGSINGEVGADVGGGGALVLNGFFIGGYGQGADYPEFRFDEDDYNLRFKHGGLWLGFVPRQEKLIHFYSSARIGWGKAEIEGDGPAAETDRVFVLIPEMGFEVNLTDFFKLAFTGGYRWTNGVTRLSGLDSADFSSPVGTITFRFGGFSDDWEDW